MMRAWWIVLKKELVDGLRDRRTILTMVFTGIVIGPLALLLMANYIGSMEDKSEARTMLIDGIERAPPLANFLARNAITAKAPPDDYRDRIAKGTLQEAVVAIPADFEKKLARGDTVDVELVFDDSRTGSQPSIRFAENTLRGFAGEIGTVRAIARGIAPQLLRPINVQRVNIATPKQQAAFLLFLIPMFGLLGSVVGCLSVALDTTAGERERGSLEPLLMNPVPTGALVAGKWTAVALFGSTVVLLMFCGFAVSTHFVTSDKLSTLFSFGLVELLSFAALAVPFAAMIGAVLMLIATFGRSFKEAQTYASYVALVVNFIPMVTLFLAPAEARWQLAVPGLAQQLVMARVLRGDVVGPIDYLVPLAVALLVTGVCLALLARLLRRETIVFGR
jgi:sodium transport system permease protein